MPNAPDNERPVINFDFDGVIFDSFEMNLAITNQYYPGISADEYREQFLGNVYNHARVTSMDPDVWFNDYKRESKKHVIFPGIVEILQELHKKYNLTIISSCRDAMIHEILKRENLDMFELVLGADTALDKTAKIQMVFDHFLNGPKESLFVTDTVGDIKEAQSMQVQSIAVSWGYHPKATLAKAKPMTIVDEPSELLETIEDFFKQ